MGPVAVSESGGAKLSKDRGSISGGSWSGEGGALDLRHVGHHVVGRRTDHRDTLVPVLHLVVNMISQAQMFWQKNRWKVDEPQGHWKTG